MRMRVFTLAHEPSIGDLSLVVGDPWSPLDRQLRVIVPIHGIGQGPDGDRTLADAYRALARELQAFAQECEAKADEFQVRAEASKE